MIFVHTASRYRDLPQCLKTSGDLFEQNCGAYDLYDKIDDLCNTQSNNPSITTLHEFVINRLGEMIWDGKISGRNVIVYVYKDGKKISEHHYSDEGYLLNNWDINLYFPDKE